MATVYGVNYTKGNDPKASNWVSAALQQGKLRIVMDSYEAAALALGSVIKAARLPKGAVVVPELSWVVGDALGTGVTLECGDNDSAGADSDRYMAATVYTAAALTRMGDQIDKSPYQVSEDCDVEIKTGVGAATGTIKWGIAYAVE